jgi:hypothetical protein
MGDVFGTEPAFRAASRAPLCGRGRTLPRRGSGEGNPALECGGTGVEAGASICTAAPLSRRPSWGLRREAKAFALVLFGFLLTTPAFAADDASSCAQGITMIRDALAANPSEAALPKLKTALRVAEREQKEGEFDECLDAVADARKALGR